MYFWFITYFPHLKNNYIKNYKSRLMGTMFIDVICDNNHEKVGGDKALE